MVFFFTFAFFSDTSEVKGDKYISLTISSFTELILTHAKVRERKKKLRIFLFLFFLVLEKKITQYYIIYKKRES